MEYCDSCGKAYEIVYDVPDEIWDKITLKKGDGFLCIECADKKADGLGIDLYWSANKGEYLSVEMERLKKRYEEPGQKCNSGHINTLPVSLWDCPICTEKLRSEIKRLKEEVKKLKGSPFKKR